MEDKDDEQTLFEKRKDEKSAKSSRLLGLGLMAGAGMFLTVGNCVVQYTHKKWPNRVTTFEVLLIRSLIQLFFTIIFMIYGKIHPYGSSPKNLVVLSLMGVAEVIAIVFVYFALERMPVGDATVIQFTAPVFTLAFSFVCLRKGCSVFDTICGCISFAGVVVMTRPTLIFGMHKNVGKSLPPHHHPHKAHSITSKPGDPAYLGGVGFALMAAILLSLFFILNKIAGRKLDVTLTILYPSILGVVISPMFKAGLHEAWFDKWNGEIWAYIVVVGFVSFVGLMFMAEALQLEDAGPAVLIRNLDVVYAFCLQFILMKLKPDLMTLFGAAIVIFATSLIALNRTCFSKLQICQKGQSEEYEYRPLISLEEDKATLKKESL